MKVLKIVAIVIGVAALALTGIGLAAGASIGGALAGATATIGATLGLSAGVASALVVGSLVIDLSMVAGLVTPHPSSGGQQEKWKADQYAGLPYAMGRTLVGGNIVYKRAHGSGNIFCTTVTALSLGPINQLEASFLEKNLTTYNATNYYANGQYASWIWQSSQLGASPESNALPVPVDTPPNWDSSCKLSGLAAVLNTFKYDKDGKKLTTIPTPSWIVQGVKVYDPRLDSTYSGGSGSCRALNESTYVYSENPALHALTWCLGRFQNGVRVAGCGHPVSAIDVPAFVEAANLCDARGWKLGGVVYTRPDTAWNSLQAMLQAAGSKPLFYRGQITCINSAPRVSLATITNSDIIGDCTFTATPARRDRINAIIPQYRSEANDWALVSASAVSVPAFQTMDGDERTKEISYPLVQDATQASQLAMYDIYNSREAGPGTVQLKPVWLNYRVGDCVTFAPETGYSIKTEIMGRALDASAGTVTFQLKGETDAKHTVGLSTTGTAAPIAVFHYDNTVAAPSAGDWTVTGTAVTAAGTSIPALHLTGGCPNPAVTSIIFEYQLTTDTNWTAAGTEIPSTTDKVITGVASGGTYYVRVTYKSQAVSSTGTVYGPITAGSLTSAGFANQGPWATYSGLVSSVVTPNANLIYDAGLTLNGQQWTLGSYTIANGGDIGNYVYTGSNSATLGIGGAMPVTAGNQYTLQMFCGGSSYSGTPSFAITFYNGSGTSLGSFTQAGPVQNVGYVRSYVTATAPTGSVTAKATFTSAGSMGGGYCGIYKPKFEVGAAGTVFTDDATYGARYTTGQTIDALQPAQAGSDVTATHTAAAITSQGALATSTLTASQVTNANIGITSAGALTGAGSGSVTIGGLGYTGDLNASYGAQTGVNLKRNSGATLTEPDIITASGTAAAIAGQGAFATYGAAISTITSPSTNIFPYPRGTLDGRTPANLGWANTSNSTWADVVCDTYAAYGGGYYQTTRSSGGAMTISPYFDLPITGGPTPPWSVSFAGLCIGGTFGSYFCFLDNSGAVISGSTTSFTFNSNTARYEASFAAQPATAKKIRLVISGTYGAASGNQYLTWWAIKVESTTAPTIYNSDGSFITGNNIQWSDGTTLNTLKPAQAGADITGTHTASAIASQGDLATANRASLAFGDNCLVNSDFTQNANGWVLTASNNVPSGTVSGGRNLSGYFGVRNVLYTTVSNPTSAASYYMFGPCQQGFAGAPADLLRYGLQVVAGDRVYARGRFAIHGGTQVIIRIRWFSYAGTLISESDNGATIGNGRSGGPTGSAGDVTNNMALIELYANCPAGANFAVWCCYGYTAAETSSYIFVAEPMMCKVPSGQIATAVPYNSGPSDRAADYTIENTASAITGQGSLATLNSVAYGSGNVTGFGGLAAKNAVNLASSDVSTIGSIPPTVPDQGFSYTATTSSITVSWPAMTVYRADGTTIAVSSGSQLFSGLGAGSTYFGYPYFADSGSTASVSFVASTLYTSRTASAAASANARGNIPLGSIAMATPASGTSGGSGGGYNCLHPSTLVGDTLAGELEVGSLVPTPLGLAPIKRIERKQCSRWFAIYSNGVEIAKVTRNHQFYKAGSGAAISVQDIRMGDMLKTAGDHIEVTGMALSTELALLVGIDVGVPHLHYVGPANLLTHNGTAKP
jgi:hypothetical protein